MKTPIDCDTLFGRPRDICRGCDERGQPVLTPAKRIAYLRLWGYDDDVIAAHVGQPVVAPSGGPGTELKALLRERYGITASGGCQCNSRAAEMDRNGVAWCEANVETIVGWLKEGAAERFWLRPLTAVLRGTTDRIARELVEEAIGRAKQKAAQNEPPPRLQAVRRRFHPGPARNWFSAFQPTDSLPRFISNQQFAADTLALIAKLPPDVTHVAGVSRSGLYPAAMIAMLLHLPLTIVRHHTGDWVPGGNGWRMNEGRPPQDGLTLVVDDTTMTGNSLRRTKHILAQMPGEKLYAAVYVNPAAKAKPDLWAVDLPWPHLLQWNLFNSVLLDSFALDFDGILCQDCPASDDDGGPRYQRFLRETPPLHLVRKRPIKLVVTARLEKYRAETLAWLSKWRIRVSELVMGPWADHSERRRADVAAFKAEHFRRFMKTRKRIRPAMFIESDPRQAQRIAELSGGLVVCPSAERCYRGS